MAKAGATPARSEASTGGRASATSGGGNPISGEWAYSEAGVGVGIWSAALMGGTAIGTLSTEGLGTLVGLGSASAGPAGGRGLGNALARALGAGPGDVSVSMPSSVAKGSGQPAGGAGAKGQRGAPGGSASRVIDKNGYPSALRAALAALSAAVPDSVARDSEYGGLIYRRGNRYYATAPITNNLSGGVEVWDALPQVPGGATIVGDYHTHPRVIDDPFVKGLWWRNGEVFSGLEWNYLTPEAQAMTPQSAIDASDIYGARLDLARPNVDADVFTSYMSSPSGRMGVHNVKAGVVTYFSPNSLLLPPGQTVPAAGYSWH